MVLNSVKTVVKNNIAKLWIQCDYDSQIKFFFPDWQKKQRFFDDILVDELPPSILSYSPMLWI
jgi:hypothetical protein